MVFQSVDGLVQEKLKIKFLLTALTTLLKPSHHISVPALLGPHWSIFSSVHSYPAFRTIFMIIGGFRNNFWNHSWLFESQNKFHDDGYWK
jgi:hypothetical protein